MKKSNLRIEIESFLDDVSSYSPEASAARKFIGEIVEGESFTNEEYKWMMYHLVKDELSSMREHGHSFQAILLEKLLEEIETADVMTADETR